ncbi:MAG TPA: dockerin type I repeat-containing protein, partial [Planctomycetota bacterium]|nr:dockerin type I repeat-containing protein [Planctomycetota bacterium]
MKRSAGKRLLVLALPAVMTFAALHVKMPGAFAQVEFLRGDANSDGKVSISDALTVRRFLFNGQIPPECGDTADFDDDGLVTITDAIANLAFLFLGRSGPAAPFPDPGPAPTGDTHFTTT